LGFDPTRLDRIQTHFAKYVDEGKLPGYHITVSRAGELAYSTKYGHADVENGKPIADDTIYRIYSMTKPICAVAAMILWDEGLFEMHDQVKWFIPSFANQKVFRSGTLTAPAPAALPGGEAVSARAARQPTLSPPDSSPAPAFRRLPLQAPRTPSQVASPAAAVASSAAALVSLSLRLFFIS
jgi:CubicO group peptidase (beta-lactamase class C family)